MKDFPHAPQSQCWLEATGSCRISIIRARPVCSARGTNIKIKGLRGKEPVFQNRCRMFSIKSMKGVVGSQVNLDMSYSLKSFQGAI